MIRLQQMPHLLQPHCLLLRIAWGYSSAHIWVLCLTKIHSLVKDASLENNTLVGKRGSIAHFPRYYCIKVIWCAQSSGCWAWPRCTRNEWMLCYWRNLQTLKPETVTAWARLRIFVLGVSFACCSTFSSMPGVRAILTLSLSALWNEVVSTSGAGLQSNCNWEYWISIPIQALYDWSTTICRPVHQMHIG